MNNGIAGISRRYDSGGRGIGALQVCWTTGSHTHVCFFRANQVRFVSELGFPDE
jgi:hypothetical protein